ncbi:hypothetical protein [Companilactobacillus sp. HBUAS59544]|uniref:hypothetical protein n=1 Tax=Companilactobacillus sp. HBUAS59544 TaxID=3109363 RepID=UPI002FF3E446
MKRIPRKQLLNFLKKNSQGPLLTITFYTFKKDRNINVVAHGNDYLVKEVGFNRQEFITHSNKEMLKLVNKLAKIEFYRSQTLYVSLG